MIFTKITFFFLQNHRVKFIAGLLQWSATCSKLSGVLVEDGFVLPSKIFFPGNASCLDAWSHREFLTTAAHIGYLADSSFRMILKRRECFSLTNTFVFLR